jgi:predicted nucleotidyltransferase
LIAASVSAFMPHRVSQSSLLCKYYLLTTPKVSGQLPYRSRQKRRIDIWQRATDERAACIIFSSSIIRKDFFMAQYAWSNCPLPVRMQIETFCQHAKDLLGSELIAIYLHGSLAMGCFNPERSDIDILVVTQQRMPIKIKYQIMTLLLDISNTPCPIEISFLTEADIHPFQHPLPFDLHYSETWRQQVSEELADGTWQHWDNQTRRDPDLAAHLTITRRRGIALYGQPALTVLPAVPGRDYATSIIGDYLDARDSCAHNPVYFALNACRVLAYLQDECIYSKDEGGVYGLTNLPVDFRSLIMQALEAYRVEKAVTAFDSNELDQFAIYMDQRILAKE